MVKISYILGQQVIAKEPAAATGQPLSLSPLLFIRSGDIDGLERDERMGTGWRGRSVCLTWSTWWALADIFVVKPSNARLDIYLTDGI
jgi:hypothetical protein